MNCVGINLQGSKHFWRCQIDGLGRWLLWIAFPQYFDICNPTNVFVMLLHHEHVFRWMSRKRLYHESINMLKIISKTIHAKTWWWWKINKPAYHQFHSTFQWYPKTNKILIEAPKVMFVYTTLFKSSKCSQQAIKQKMNKQWTMLALSSMHCLLLGRPLSGCTMTIPYHPILVVRACI